MKASQLRRSPLASIKLISPCPVTKVCCFIRNRILPLNSAGQTRVVAKAYIVLGVFSDQQPQKILLFGNLWFLGEVVYPWCRLTSNIYIHTPTYYYPSFKNEKNDYGKGT